MPGGDMSSPEEHTRRLAEESLAHDDATGWFERLYVAAQDGAAGVPWDRGAPHPLLEEWARGVDGRGRRAIVVGCGLGADAEHIAGLGFDTTAFDIATTAVQTARARFPDTRVEYVTADLFAPPAPWRQGFDLVFESLTVQSLPVRLHREAIARVADLVGPGGTLLVVSTGRSEADGPVAGPPWPLTRAEIEAFASDGGLRTVRIEDLRDAVRPEIRRWRAEFRRASVS
jgi:SAM-dependent methyltransferase